MADNANPYLIGAGIGANVLGGILQNKQNNQANQYNQQDRQRLIALAQQEQARKDLMMKQLFPMLGRDMGNSSIGQMGSAYGQLGAGGGAGGGSGFTGVPQMQGSTASKGIGLAGGLGATGAGIGSMLGVSALGGPVGLAIGGAGALGSAVASQIGKGRRTANTATQGGGYEQQFDQAMAEAVRRRDAGDTEGAKQVLQQGYQTFQAGSGAYQGQGGQYATVANQALTQNSPKWTTYESIKRSLGMQ